MWNALRWFVFIPAALIGAALAHFMMKFGQGMAWGGFEDVGRFWRSTDMQGFWIRGTMALIFVEGFSGFVSTYVAGKVVRQAPLRASKIWIFTLAILWVVATAIIIFSPAVSMSFSTWYRSIVQGLAFIGGGVVALDSIEVDAEIEKRG